MSQSPFRLNKQSTLTDILAANKSSTNAINSLHPEIIKLAGQGQSPHTLWIGCSDSRVNECTALGCLPGEVFTVRNIGNVVTTGDLACMSAIQFAIESLKVSRIIICGHTDCGGMWGALKNQKSAGPLDSWLLPVREIRYENLDLLKAQPSDYDRNTALSKLNVLHSVDMVEKHPSFVEAHRKRNLQVYGVLYDVKTGYMKQISNLKGEDDKKIEHVFDLRTK